MLPSAPLLEGVATYEVATPSGLSFNEGLIEKDGLFAVGNNWYIVLVNGTHTNVRCSIGGNGFRPGGSFYTRTLNLGANLVVTNNNDFAQYGSYYNGTHLIVISGDHTAPNPKRFYAITLNCPTMTVVTNTTIITTGQEQAPQAITQNGTHTFAVINGNAGSDLWRSDLSGITWTNVTRFATTKGCCTAAALIINWTNNRIVVIILQGAALQSRVYYTKNQTFGTLTAIATIGNGNIQDFDCVTGTRIYCTYLADDGTLQYRYFDGSSWSVVQTIAYPNPIYGGRLALTKNNGDDTIFVFRLPRWPTFSNNFDWDGTIKWNKTATNGTTFVSQGDFLWHTAITVTNGDDSPSFLSVSHRPNSTGYIGTGLQNTTTISGSTSQLIFGVFGAYVITPPPSQGGGGGGGGPPPFFPPIEQVPTPTVPQNQNLLPPELIGLAVLIILITSFILIYANRKSIGGAGKNFKVGGF